jgi:hypothetical protein
MLPIGIKRACDGPLTRDQGETCAPSHLEAQTSAVRNHVRRVLRQISAGSLGHAATADRAEPRG